jgi:hypothetical protein
MPQTCQTSCHTPLPRLLSVAEGIITLIKMEIQAFSNKFEYPDFPFLWGSE